jgi:hypothetical protein
MNFHYTTLKLVLVLLYFFSSTNINAQASQGFEGITTTLNCTNVTCYYTDPDGFATQHFLADAAGIPVSQAGAGSTLGFITEFTPSRTGTSPDGLSVDAFGVAGSTLFVSNLTTVPPEGNQGFFMQDPDGWITMYFDYVDLSSTTNPMMSLQYHLESTSWEVSEGANDRLYVRIEIDNCAGATTVTLIDTDGGGSGGGSGGDIDLLSIENAWNTLSANLSAYVGCRAQLIIEFDSNSTSEELGLDNIIFTQGTRQPLTNCPDMDNDGVCDADDICANGDDNVDSDFDGVPDACDLCFGPDSSGDTDGDGVCDVFDPCPLDNPNDSDGDGVCDSADICEGNDATGDSDGDGICDNLDPCEGPDNVDADFDGICDSIDPCFGDNSTGDSDGDGICDNLDPCFGPDNVDSDGDGNCDSVDLCAGNDATGDSDGDGVCDDFDPCPLDDPNDSDGDGVCDSADICDGNDATGDSDGDGVCDNLDGCPFDPNNTDIANCGCAEFGITAPGVWNGDTSGASDKCSSGSPTIAYRVVIPYADDWTFSLCGSTFNTYMELGYSCCDATIDSNDDSCGSQSEFVSINLLPGPYFITIRGVNAAEFGAYTLTISPSDPCIGETDPPSLTCPATQSQSFNANCQAILADYTSFATVSDECDENPVVTQSPTPGTTISGNTTVTLTATDASGNSTSCSFTVVLEDNSAPGITCPATQSETANANCEAMLSDYTSLASVSDNCDTNPTVTQSPTPGTSISGNTTVALTATDASGNSTSCSFTVILEDNSAPGITCPATQSETANANCEAMLSDYTSLASVSDNCDANPTVTQSPTPGTSISGNTTVTLTATDASGNSTSCTFTVILEDNSAPGITCPATQSETADANCEAMLSDYTSLASVSDNCDANPTVTQSPTPGTSISGNTTVTLIATDASGNSTSCSFTVVLEDNSAPGITCPNTQFENVDANCQSVLGDYTGLVTTGDNCDNNVSVSQSPAPGSIINGATSTAVTLIATDASGNSTSCTFNVITQDVTPPSISCASDFTVNTDPGFCGADVSLPIPQWDDNCLKFLLEFRYRAVDENDNPLEIWTAWFSGFNMLFFNAGRYEVEWRAQDGVPNYNYCTYYFDVIDNQAPDAVCNDITVFLNPDGTYSIQNEDVLDFDATNDNCGFEVIQLSPANLDCSDLGETKVVKVTIQDDNGNSDICVATVTVLENGPVPPPWTDNEVGGATGEAGYNPCDGEGGTFTLSSQGFSSPFSDQVEYVHQELCGNGEIIARVLDVNNGGWAGVMMRETLATGSKKAVIKTQLSSLVRREVRTFDNGPIQSQQFFRPNAAWLRLLRIGNNFVGYSSTNGINWQFAFFANINMNSCIEVGIFSEGTSNFVPTTALFDNVIVSGGVQPLADNGNNNSATVPEGQLLDVQLDHQPVQIYPNPTSGIIAINVEKSNDEMIQAEIFNVAGQKVFEGEWPDPTQELDLTQFRKGIYLIRLKIGEHNVVKRIILQ